MTEPATAQRPAGDPRDSLVIRGGHVITMDPREGGIPGGDVLVSGGRIIAAGPGLAVPPGTTELDAVGRIVLPGLVDTHWHMACVPGPAEARRARRGAVTGAAEIIHALPAGRERDAIALVFGYMAGPLAETGGPAPPAIGELPPVLRNE